PPAEEWAGPPSENVINRFYQVLSSRLPSVEYLIGYEGNAFAFTGDVEDDLLSITAVHPMREEAVESLLDRAGADWSAVDKLVQDKKLTVSVYNRNNFDSVVEGDVVINEILFNPPDGAEDYVELYNRSGKFIDLYDLRMATRDDSLRVDGLEMITDVGFLLFPGDYVVLSENIAAVENNYYCKYPDQLLQVEDLPTYKNSEGDVVLCIPNKEVIDEVVYNEDMHFKLLRSVKGVSLERIDYNEPASDENNWHSAAESVGFGTPTYQNSQYKSSETAESMFELSPETISPDNDGYEDVLTISYKMDKPGYVLSISIYNSKGQPVRNLIDNEMLGSEGQFTWDGLNDDGMHPGSGIYIVLLDYFDLDGNRHQEKKTTVIAVKR
ncbi:MAG: lamin tail domain-containing protein, partial [Bacteroidales bacterium]